MSNLQFVLFVAAFIVLLVIVIALNHRITNLETFCGLLLETASNGGDLKDMLKVHGKVIHMDDDQSRRG